MTDSPHSPIAKPCPFCGCDAEIRSWPFRRDVTRYQVHCSVCEATTGNPLRGFITEQDAISEWNRRSSSVLEELEAIEFEMREVENEFAGDDSYQQRAYRRLADRLHALIGRYREPK